MRLCEALVKNGARQIAFVGGGGKTTAIFRLARELCANGQSVLVTTTTHMLVPSPGQCDRLFLSAEELRAAGSPSGITMLGAGAENGKLRGVDPLFLDMLYDERAFDAILTEADGAKRRPVKAPGAHEPVVPRTAEMIVGLIGLDCLEKPVSEEFIHRPERFARLCGIAVGAPVTADALVCLASCEDGLFKGAPQGAARALFLNKAQSPALLEAGTAIARRVLACGAVQLAAVGNAMREDPVLWMGDVVQ